MIITCPSCEKQFQVDSNLIPDKGKLVQCGVCNQTWFFNKHDQTNIENKKIKQDPTDVNKKTLIKPLKKNYQRKKDELSNLSNNKGSELIKYEPKSKLTVGKILNYIIVIIISFVAVILVIDTFKGPLSTFFPNIELLLYNFYETLKDLILFIKDLK